MAHYNEQNWIYTAKLHSGSFVETSNQWGSLNKITFKSSHKNNPQAHGLREIPKSCIFLSMWVGDEDCWRFIHMHNIKLKIKIWTDPEGHPAFHSKCTESVYKLLHCLKLKAPFMSWRSDFFKLTQRSLYLSNFNNKVSPTGWLHNLTVVSFFAWGCLKYFSLLKKHYIPTTLLFQLQSTWSLCHNKCMLY